MPYFNFYKKQQRSHLFKERYSTQPYEPDCGEAPDQLICSFDVLEEQISPKITLKNAVLFQISTWIWHGASISLALSKDKPVDTYTRVGIAEVPNIDGLAEGGWVTKDICII